MHGPARRARFGDFELDAESGTLLRQGRRVRLQPQPLRVLGLLVERAGQVVSRDDIRRAIWDQATFVEFDQGLNYCIRQIRQALNDDAVKPAFVETLKKRGYIFIAPVERVGEPVVEPRVASVIPAGRPWPRLAIYAAVAMAVLAAIAARVFSRPQAPSLTYTQLTSFNEAAFAPALSPDGRMIAFIVGSDISFPTAGEIYTKLLPDSEPVQRTRDGWPKYGLTFSPDGSQIAYTVADAAHGFGTASLPALGGDSRPLLPNAAGLTWLDRDHALFSEVKSGLHMGLVTATTSRSNLRDIYLPQHDRGMVHYASASPDRSHVLIVEMGPTGGWERCRLVPFDGSSAGVQVGPGGACTAAAWSVDGAWMYFTARVNGASHVWRQRFPDGALEQLTFGPAEEAGLAMSADGRSIVTSVGIFESGAWMHDQAGDHLISPEGYAAAPSFSRDGGRLYYLLRRESGTGANDIWKTDVASGKSEAIVTGFAVNSYDVSPDGRQVVFSARNSDGLSQLWVADLEAQTRPRLLVASGGTTPFFGPAGDVVFRMSDGTSNYLFDLKPGESQPTKILQSPIIGLKGVSPDRTDVVVMVPVAEVLSTAVVALSLQDGSTQRICPGECMAKWSPDGARFYVEPVLQGAESGKAVVIPVPNGASIPVLPASGVRSASDAAFLPGSTVIDLSAYDPAHFGATVAPGPAKDTFAFTKTNSHRNLFEVTLPP
jgi:DNA-binding winged helix-turn-helix (wHTH) protein/Tol biopolymer transport system component